MKKTIVLLLLAAGLLGEAFGLVAVARGQQPTNDSDKKLAASIDKLDQAISAQRKALQLPLTQSALWDEINNDPSLKDCRESDWPDTATCSDMARATLRIARQYWVRDHAKRTPSVKQK